MSNPHLLVVGELNVDLILNDIQGVPQVGTEIVANEMTLALGSSSAILAANASALGVKTSFCSAIGQDSYGELVLRELQKSGVNTDYIKTFPSHPTGISVLLNYDQDRACVTYCGAMELLTIEDVPWEHSSAFQHLHLSNFFLQKGLQPDVIELFRRAKNAGLTTSLDLQWDITNRWDFNYQNCLPYVDVFFPNESELLALTHCDDLEVAIKQITPYTNTLAIKRGEHGSIGIANKERVTVAPFKADRFVDAIGAGDSFNAGFLKKYLNGASLNDCLDYGNLMGALNTTAAGGTAAFGNMDNIRKHVRERIGVEGF